MLLELYHVQLGAEFAAQARWIPVITAPIMGAILGGVGGFRIAMRVPGAWGWTLGALLGLALMRLVLFSHPPAVVFWLGLAAPVLCPWLGRWLQLLFSTQPSR